MATARYSDRTLNRIFDKNGGHCWHCGKQLAWSNYGRKRARGAWEVDHSIARYNGGTDQINNLVPSCISCNRSKGPMNTRQFSG